jgi:hypothetical protein
MKQSSIFNRAGEFWSNDNINAVRKSFDIFLNFPESKQISFASNSYLTVDSTNNAPKYDMYCQRLNMSLKQRISVYSQESLKKCQNFF